MTAPVININPIDQNTIQPIESIKYDHDSRTFDVQLGDDVIKVYLRYDDDGNTLFEANSVEERTERRCPY